MVFVVNVNTQINRYILNGCWRCPAGCGKATEWLEQTARNQKTI